MRFDTKIGIVVRADLATWQRLNVTAFLASSVAGGLAEKIVGQPYEDGSGNVYLPMFRQPVLIYGAESDELSQVRERAVARDLEVAIYTEDMFSTGDDDANRAVVRPVPAEKLNLVGLAVYGPKNRVDKVLKGLELHP